MKYISKTMYSSSSSTTSPHRLYTQPWIFSLCLLIFHLTTLSCSSASTTHHHNHDEEEISYADHCASIVPESTTIFNPGSNIFSFPRSLTGYFYITAGGSNGILSQDPVHNSSDSLNYLSFRTQKVQMTSVDGVFKVEAMARLKSPDMSYTYYDHANYTNTYDPQGLSSTTLSSRIGLLHFRLNGFWSESSGKLCMVGLGDTYSKQTGELINLAAVFKLIYFKNSSILTSLGTGSLESLSSVDESSYFQKVSMFTFADKKNYHYSLIFKEFGDGAFNGSGDVTESLPISSQSSRSLCSVLSSLSSNMLELKYPSDCQSAKNCTLFGEDIGYLPSVMALNLIQCSDKNQRVRVLVKFLNNSYSGNYQSFNPNTTLIGEGFWDEKKNHLCVVACKILNVSGSLNDAHIGDCSIRLTLRFPAVWSMRKSRNILGEIWSSKPVNDSEYFDNIVYQSTENLASDVRGLRYEYTLINQTRKLCPSKKSYKNKMKRYPNVHDMILDMSVSSSKEGKFGWGYLIPIFVGEQLYDRYQYAMAMAPASSSGVVDNTDVKINSSLLVPMNISYKISFSDISNSSNPYMPMEISAEGIYDPKIGDLCMIGCKTIDSKDQVLEKDSLDCGILVKYQFPSLNSKKNGGYIKGSIESTREKTDPLYFEPLGLSSTAFIASTAEENSSRMDIEVTMLLISTTLACVFVAFQLSHVRKHPQMLPFVSLVMLAVLTLGYMIPLLLNFEDLFLQNRDRQNVVLESGKWLEVNEVLVRVVTMIAFLLQLRLLQMTWSSRVGDGGKPKKDFWTSEKNAFLYVSLPLYATGAFIAWFVNQQNNNNNGLSLQHSIWGNLKSYAGLVLDTFLLPHIILNMFGNTREKALSFSYYMGTTFVRLLPHAYDLYRAHSSNNARETESLYIYANHGVDYYSTSSDVVIPCVALVFAAVIFLQQQFGGRCTCVLPRRFREVEEVYEKVPVVMNESF